MLWNIGLFKQLVGSGDQPTTKNKRIFNYSLLSVALIVAIFEGFAYFEKFTYRMAGDVFSEYMVGMLFCGIFFSSLIYSVLSYSNIKLLPNEIQNTALLLGIGFVAGILFMVLERFLIGSYQDDRIAQAKYILGVMTPLLCYPLLISKGKLSQLFWWATILLILILFIRLLYCKFKPNPDIQPAKEEQVSP